MRYARRLSRRNFIAFQRLASATAVTTGNARITLWDDLDTLYRYEERWLLRRLRVNHANIADA